MRRASPRPSVIPETRAQNTAVECSSLLLSSNLRRYSKIDEKNLIENRVLKIARRDFPFSFSREKVASLGEMELNERGETYTPVLNGIIMTRIQEIML